MSPRPAGGQPGGAQQTVTKEAEFRQSLVVLLNPGGRDESSGFPRHVESAEQNPQEEAVQIEGSVTLWPNTKLSTCRVRLHQAAPKRMTREERGASGAMTEWTQ